MHSVERLAAAVRHLRVLEGSLGLWNWVRPWYRRLLGMVERRGLRRMINGTDLVFLAHDLHGISETYEPDMWAALMAEVRPGDVVVDVGAYIGLYAVALARRVGGKGRVYAFEPDSASYRRLCQHVHLNGVDDRVHIFPWAVGAESAFLHFAGGRGSESSVAVAAAPGAERVEAVRLDAALAGTRLDLIKIDVEGYELHVLRGAAGLLGDPACAPRSLFIEVHPFAWARFGLTDRSLLETLWGSGYRVCDLAGTEVDKIEKYGVIVARRRDGGGNGG